MLQLEALAASWRVLSHDREDVARVRPTSAHQGRVTLALRTHLQLSVGMSRRARSTLMLLAASLVTVMLPAATAHASVSPDPDYSAYVPNFPNVASYQSMGQAFVAPTSGTVTQVSLGLTDYSSAGSLTVTLETVNGSDMPTGVILSTATLGHADVPNSPANAVVPITFLAPATVTAGTEYVIVLRSATGVFGWADAASVYPGHPRVWNNGVQWQVLNSPVTASFAVYITPILGGDDPSPVLQQVGLPASGSCADLSTPSLNWGGASSGGWGQSWAMWPNGGRGGSVCTRTLMYSSALGHWIAA